MTIDWTHFTPWESLAGGMLIGLTAAILFYFNGRIAGMSGIVGGLFKPVKGDIAWRVAVVLGLLCAPLFYQLHSALPPSTIDADSVTLIIAGILVGFGARYGSGCTSGHGVCGLSRGSLRSLVATIVFMMAGMMTVYFVRHLMA